MISILAMSVCEHICLEWGVVAFGGTTDQRMAAAVLPLHVPERFLDIAHATNPDETRSAP